MAIRQRADPLTTHRPSVASTTRKKVGLCWKSARISHEHFSRSSVTHCPRGHNIQAKVGCTGQSLSLSAKLKPLPFTIHIFRVTGRRGGRLQVLFRRSPNFHHRPPAMVRRRSLYFGPASRQSRHREMLIGPGLADNRIEKRTAEKANFVLELTRRPTKGRLERGAQWFTAPAARRHKREKPYWSAWE